MRYPTDAGLAGDGVGLLARAAGKLKERLERGRTRLVRGWWTARASRAGGCGRSAAH